MGLSISSKGVITLTTTDLDIDAVIQDGWGYLVHFRSGRRVAVDKRTAEAISKEHGLPIQDSREMSPQ